MTVKAKSHLAAADASCRNSPACFVGSNSMESATFRKWLEERGCVVDPGKHYKGGRGHAILLIRREGRRAELPIVGAHHPLDPREVGRVCAELDLDPATLPGPTSRV
jgi:hypothetical protein